MAGLPPVVQTFAISAGKFLAGDLQNDYVREWLDNSHEAVTLLALARDTGA